MIFGFGKKRAPARLRLDLGVSSRPGTYDINEDAAGDITVDGLTLLAIADGLGGHTRGEVASRLAVDRAVALFRRLPSLEPERLEALVRDAHAALRDAQTDRNDSGFRTTLTLLASDGVAARCAHVGDTRAYLFQDRQVRMRTRDHSVPEMLHRTGEIRDDEIRLHPDRGRLLQALGQDGDPKVAVSDAVLLKAGDAILLCSDGWWGGVADEQMEDTLRGAPTAQDWLARMSEIITTAARTPQDNYTAIAAFVV